jgi:hypothetical protein
MITAGDDLVLHFPAHDEISRDKQGDQDDKDGKERDLFYTSACYGHWDLCSFKDCNCSRD